MAKSISRGPGTVIRQTLAAWYITEHSGCVCTDIANEMDSVGPDEVEKNIDNYTQRMYDSIKDWKATGNIVERHIPLPPVALVTRLIEYGIFKSRQEATAAA